MTEVATRDVKGAYLPRDVLLEIHNLMTSEDSELEELPRIVELGLVPTIRFLVVELYRRRHLR